MMIRYKWPNHPRQDRPMTVFKAVEHALSDSDPGARATDTADIVGRLLTCLHSKGVLLPKELIYVLGEHKYEEANTGNGKAETPTR